MAFGFPLYIDLNGNNCTIFGGGDYAADKAETLRRFGARITVIAPTLCERLVRMDEQNEIRYIPRKYYRGDCSNAMLCVAATEQETMNITIASECKAKSIPVNVQSPAAFGNFCFPEAIIRDDLQISLVGDRPAAEMRRLCDRLNEQLDQLIDETCSK